MLFSRPHIACPPSDNFEASCVHVALSAESLILYRDINPTLRIHRTQHSRTPLRDLFDLRAYTSAPLPSSQQQAGTHGHIDIQDQEHHLDHSFDSRKGTSAAPADPHFGRISTVTIPLPPLSIEQFDRLQRFLEDTLWVDLLSQPAGAPASGSTAPAIGKATEGHAGDTIPTSHPAPESKDHLSGSFSAPAALQPAQEKREILRTKGILRMMDGREHILQGVTDVFEIKGVPAPSSTASNAEAEQGGKVVFIGRGVGETLRDELLTAIRIS